MHLRRHPLTRREVLTALATSVVGALASTRLAATPLQAERVGELDLVPPLPADDPSQPPTFVIPPRPAGAPGASELLDALKGETLRTIEERLVEEILGGNVPSFLRTPRSVPMRNGSTVWASSDYLAVGDDGDYARVPLTAPAARQIAEALGAVLPTPDIVDAIHAAADAQLPGIGLDVPVAQRWLAQSREHERRIESNIRERAIPRDALLSGHKKDVVVSPALAALPGRVAIYGLFVEGEPVQRLSTVHYVTYVDYSHGVRLIADAIDHRGQRRSLRAVLRSREAAALVSRAGPIDLPVYPRSWQEALDRAAADAG